MRGSSSAKTISAISARVPWPAPRNFTTYVPSSSPATMAGSEPPSRSGITYSVAVMVRIIGRKDTGIASAVCRATPRRHRGTAIDHDGDRVVGARGDDVDASVAVEVAHREIVHRTSGIVRHALVESAGAVASKI